MFFFCVLFLLAAIGLSGCSSNVISGLEPEEVSSAAETDGAEADPWGADTTVLGEVSHGLRREEIAGLTENGYVTYEGGELTIPYRVSVSGNAHDIGFLVLLDGQPQAYHTDTAAEDAYCHVLELEDGAETDFTIAFTPSTGQAGDTLYLTVLSIWHPNFMPDMVETSGYGMYHQTLEMNCAVKLEADPPAGAAQPVTDPVVKDLAVTETDLTAEYLEGPISLNYGMTEITQESLDDNIYEVVLFDGTYEPDHYAISQGQLTVALELCGKDGTEYYVTPFINHTPISEAQSVTVKKGKISTLTVTFDAAGLEDLQTFYFIAVPADPMNFMRIKTSSVLLYRGSADTGAAETQTENSGGSTGSIAQFDAAQFRGGIEDLFYAGDDQVIVYADDFYLYDRKTESVAGTFSVSEGRVSLRKFFRTADGYALIGNVAVDASASLFSGGTSKKCWLFDENLSCTKTIDLGELIARENDPFALGAAVSGDGESIAVAGNNALYRYDIAQDSLYMLFDYDETNYADYMTVNQLAFTGSDEKIVFEATALDSATNGNTQIYGLVSVDGSDLVCYTVSDYALTDEIIVQSDEIWFPEAFDQAAGKLLVTDTDGKRLRVVDLEGEDTGADGVYGSTNGEHIATKEWLDEEGSWRIRIYDADSGEIVHEELCKPTRENYSTTYCKVRILDEQQECIVIAGREQETELFSFSF